MTLLRISLENNCRLKELYLGDAVYFGNPDNISARANFFTVLQNPNSSLEKLRVRCSSIDDEAIDTLKNSLVSNSRLKVLEVTAAGWAAFSTILQYPNSALEVLDLLRNCCIHNRVLFHFADALRNNSKMRELLLPDSNNITIDGYAAFSPILCDSASIVQTYHSNHTLEKLFNDDRLRIFTTNRERKFPEDIRSLLQLNEDNKRSEAARLKIIHSHFSHFSGRDMNLLPFTGMEMNVIPHAIAWMGRDDCRSNEISAILFSRIRSMPLLCCDTRVKSKKREKDEVEIGKEEDKHEGFMLEPILSTEELRANRSAALGRPNARCGDHTRKWPPREKGQLLGGNVINLLDDCDDDDTEQLASNNNISTNEITTLKDSDETAISYGGKPPSSTPPKEEQSLRGKISNVLDDGNDNSTNQLTFKNKSALAPKVGPMAACGRQLNSDEFSKNFTAPSATMMTFAVKRYPHLRKHALPRYTSKKEKRKAAMEDPNEEDAKKEKKKASLVRNLPLVSPQPKVTATVIKIGSEVAHPPRIMLSTWRGKGKRLATLVRDSPLASPQLQIKGAVIKIGSEVAHPPRIMLSTWRRKGKRPKTLRKSKSV